MSPNDVAGKFAAKYRGEACTEWKYNRIGGKNFALKSNQQTKSLTSMYKMTGE
jgi:hypothetical protein